MNEEEYRKLARKIQQAINKNKIIKEPENSQEAQLVIEIISRNTNKLSREILERLGNILEKYKLTDYYHHNNLVQWQGFINCLIGLPDKLAKFIYTLEEPSSQFQSKPFLVKISQELVGLVKQISSLSDIQPASIILNKLIGVRFISQSINCSKTALEEGPHDLISSIWPELISLPKHHQLTWNSIILSLPRNELKAFLLSFLIHLQSNLCFDTPFSTNDQSYMIECAGAELLRYYFGDWGAENHHGCTDIHELVIEILCFHNCRDSWKIDIARWIARWTCINTSYHARSLISKNTLNAFSNSHQISNGAISHQSFLLVLLLLTSKPIAKSTPCDLSLDTRFIDAIQRSLNSLRIEFRLIGILMAELMTELYRSSGDTKLDFGHDFDSKKDDNINSLCRNIRDLCRSWNPILDSNTIEWRDKLRLTSDPRVKKPPEIKSGSGFSSDSLKGKSMMDPDQITLTELCLNPSTLYQKVKKPIIEVLKEESNEFEAYEIEEEDLQTLDPVQSNLKSDVDVDYPQDQNQIPTKPVYFSQLSDYLKDSQSYLKIKIVLLHAEDLIRTKSNWGTELKENVIDLTITISNLQDNFDLDGFESSRKSILQALLISNPILVGECIIEQLFYHQYSIIQRLSMINAIILGILELLDLPSHPSSSLSKKGDNDHQLGFKKMKSDLIHQVLLDYQSPSSTNARRPDEEQTRFRSSPSSLLVGSNQLDFDQQPRPKWISQKLVTQRNQNSTQVHSISSSSSTSSPKSEVYAHFLQLMVTRLTWYLDQYLHLSITNDRQQDKTGVFSGSGWMILFEPILVLKIIDLIKLLSFINLSSDSHTSNMGLVKEVVPILIKILIFVRASPSDKLDKDDDDSSMDVNDHQIMSSIIKLIVTLISHLKFDTAIPNPHLMPKTIGLNDVLLQSDDQTTLNHQIQFDILYQKLISLVQIDGHRSSVSSLAPNLNQFYTIVDQILYLI
ncbi:hypothetical protein Pst134EA_022660 [Puccinia striiformis f. sp. tritici]|uniref:hypothetical protein n=1 Tax=Puccinia striiformis f. sp. tritici TaxID=168172 RepID=UPI002008A454|nr:hypothetical protein Pst134EA_022660 [Puccinia striiformis f. sp. tritici]KAH9455184.1 hypothetical protein Pst134EA_022660 [Puccinia striiformis f. sp. tritici]